MMNWLDHCLGFQGGGMMMIGMVIFWGLLVFLGFYFLKTLLNGKDTRDGTHINILKERLARGEITEDEFDHLRQTLLK
ncbi:SHOCT domain-containing protein [Schinkia azotoformans]|uniref:SHOCT domain-containing protein n=1 Tax=Schinkia azotoformans TaxID=1454 RepID=UPI002DBF9334|nr:SHOCT domain-containing protein [Schinkia azotoformans]MEC1743330.1 SHOCT domain-containing protein [Schinkia azotoformans]MEC1769500.1 SHOCT domain-containing protein [Schinkia azotoformans]MEC1788665.1 SHOCT domain-containing protein [Schinkia azotoformans]MED4377336.1 SHOCT domain-containing protein [Schinkia azotoformans]MED4420173.1 SHOCT domain-containing protein [Schinkia azotoformans]